MSRKFSKLKTKPLPRGGFKLMLIYSKERVESFSFNLFFAHVSIWHIRLSVSPIIDPTPS
jgi:hypothetical protein